MKQKLFITLAFFFCALQMMARESMTNEKIDSIATDEVDSIATAPADEEFVCYICEEMPSFPGGEAALQQFIAKTMKYPKAAQKAGIQGRVLCQFIVEPDGSLSNFDVKRSPDESLSKEAIRILKASPKWIPGKQNGQTVRVNYTLPIGFRL